MAAQKTVTGHTLRPHYNIVDGGYNFWFVTPPDVSQGNESAIGASSPDLFEIEADDLLEPFDEEDTQIFLLTDIENPEPIQESSYWDAETLAALDLNIMLNSQLVSPDELKPLVIFLHGASLKGTNLDKVLRYGTLDALKMGLNLDAYILAPQTQGAWVPARIMKTVDYVLANNPGIDPNRIYVIGMSLGGYGTIDLAATYPDRIAAAMAICGGGSVRDLTTLNRVPLWIVHGTADTAVPISESDKVVDKMRSAQQDTPRLIYTRVPGMNHSQPARLLYMAEVYQWLFSHSLIYGERQVAPGFDINVNVMSDVYSKLRSGRGVVPSAVPHSTD